MCCTWKRNVGAWELNAFCAFFEGRELSDTDKYKGANNYTCHCDIKIQKLYTAYIVFKNTK